MFRLDPDPNNTLRMFERYLIPFAYYFYKVEGSLNTAIYSKHVRILRRMRRYYV